MTQHAIPGYTYGTSAVPRSPISLEDFRLMKEAALFTDEDVQYLRMSRPVLADQVDAVLDVWYNFIASHPQLAYYFTDRSTGQLDQRYLAAVRGRFAQWILDTSAASYDQQWIDYQYEIGLRHTSAAKNKTDNVNSVDQINFRYLVPLIYPVTATLKPFLAKKGHSAEDVDKMHQAWIKSVLLQITLWSQAYVKEGEF